MACEHSVRNAHASIPLDCLSFYTFMSIICDIQFILWTLNCLGDHLVVMSLQVQITRGSGEWQMQAVDRRLRYSFEQVIWAG